MSTKKVSVYGQSLGGGYLQAGLSQSHTISPVEYGEILWVAAMPRWRRGESRELEVKDLRYCVDGNGNMVVNYEIYNTGEEDCAYYLYAAWTAKIPTPPDYPE